MQGLSRRYRLEFEWLEERLLLSGDLIGDTLLTAQLVPIAPGETRVLTDEIGTSSDVDMYEVDLQAGNLIKASIITGPTSNLDSYLRVFDNTGLELKYNDDSDGSDASLQYLVPSDGRFFIGVSAYPNSDYRPDVENDASGDTTGSYTLKLDLVGDGRDIHNTLDSAVAVPIVQGVQTTLHDYLSTPSGIDIYSVQLQRGQLLSVDLEADDSVMDTYLRVLDSSGKTIAYNDDFDDQGISKQRIYAVSSGIYYIGVSTYPNFNYDPHTGIGVKGNTEGGYSLTLDASTAILDGDDTLDSARSVTVSPGVTTTVSGKIDHNQDVDLYAFHLNKGDTAYFQVVAAANHGTLDGFMRLFNANGTQLDKNDDAADGVRDPALEFTATQEGVYYVGLSSYSDSDYDPTIAFSGTKATSSYGPYLFQVNVEASLPEDIDSIKEQDDVTGALDEDQTHRYALKIDGAGQLSVNVTADGDGLDPVVKLFGPNDQLLVESDNLAAGDTAAGFVQHLRRGLYFIEVSAAHGTRGEGNYEITTSFEVSSLPFQSAPVGLSPVDLLSWDFNGDGFLDVAALDTDSDAISILLGNGDGTFQPETRLDVQAGPAGFALGDFNHDGNADLAVGGKGIFIFYGDSDGSFSDGEVLPSSQPCVTVAAGDFNGDGFDDIAEGDGFSSKVRVFLADPLGGFDAPVAYQHFSMLT